MKSKLEKELYDVGLRIHDYKLYDLCGYTAPIDKIEKLLKPYQSLITRLTIGIVLSFLLNVWALWGIYGN